MPKRSSKPTADPNQAAASIVAAVTDESIAPVPERNAAALEQAVAGVSRAAGRVSVALIA